MKPCALAAVVAATRLLVGRIRTAEAQVVLDRAVEQVGVLGNDGNHAAHLSRIEVAQITSADTYRPALRLIQPRQQPHDGGLSRRRWARQWRPAPRRRSGTTARCALPSGRRDRRS